MRRRGGVVGGFGVGVGKRGFGTFRLAVRGGGWEESGGVNRLGDEEEEEEEN